MNGDDCRGLRYDASLKRNCSSEEIFTACASAQAWLHPLNPGQLCGSCYTTSPKAIKPYHKQEANFMKVTVIAILLLLPITATAQQRVGSSEFAPPGKLVVIGGYRLHLNCVGKNGPTVVLIARGGDFSFHWSLVQPDISRFACVFSYDRAGLAWSDPGPTPRTMRQDAYELHMLLRAPGSKRPTFSSAIPSAG